MRAWWWILITAHLVWGDPERFKDDYRNTDNLESNQNSVKEDQAYPNFILNPKAFYTSIRRSSEGDEREKKQLRFHSWGGKRQGDEEEDDVGDNSDTEDNVAFHEPGSEDLMTEDSSYLPPNASHLQSDGPGNSFSEAFTKQLTSPPVFSSWVGKGEPETVNDVSKRAAFYSPILQQNLLDSKLEQSRKRYPSFSSWAGKRAAAFNSWGGKRAAAFNSWGGKRVAVFNSWAGKRDYSTENREHPKINKDNPKPKIHFNDQVDFNNDQVYTSLNSNSLDSENNLNIQDHDSHINIDGDHSFIAKLDGKEHYSQEERHFLPEFENLILKRATAFNSWGGKRMSEETPAIVKEPTSFHSWTGKRAAAFNSWGGKRAAAFNSWGGKRAEAFNSWGGKRAAAFNSHGGKRVAAFNSWGGKRAAAFNSWGGKRGAAFNSWGGKRDVDKWNENHEIEYPTTTTDRDLHYVHFPVIHSYKTNFEPKINELLDQADKSSTNKDYIFKPAINNNLDKTNDKLLKSNVYVLFNDNPFTSVEAEELKNHKKDSNKKPLELLGHGDRLEKRIQTSFASWAGKRSPLFSSWYGGKIPAVLLTSGKRRPAFSSWGGKRSEHKTVAQPDCPGDENKTLQKPDEVHTEELSPPDEKTYTRKKREMEECSGEKSTCVLTIERDKRSSGNLLKNRVFTRMMIQGGWPMAFQSMTRGKDFFAWGGKRSLNISTLR